ncbi:MAG: acyl carrier protein [Kiritimatiellia bacterium]|nr:acyl carrier protein [Kiritimatiellia bacterium]
MTESSIQEQLVRRVADILAVPPESIRVADPLHTLGLDSMRMVEILVFVEKQFKLDLMELNLNREDLFSIEALARTIGKHRSA